MEDLSGKQFGNYQIVAPLGEGGMAAVYKAYQPSMERFVAIKVLPRHMASSEEFRNRFRREAKLLAQLQHPNILPVFDYGESEGYPYIVMPFVPSGTLAELMGSQHLPLAKVHRIISQIGNALAYAHARGMIHRDIKPSNVLIDESGNCLLTDFGLARMTESSTKITSSGTVLGTPAYMSPEQGTGSEIDHRSDIYSLGIILYEMVTGRVPYNAETPIAIVFKHIQDPLPSAKKINPDVPDTVELVLLKALAKNPEDRYQNMEEFLHSISKAIPEDELSTPKTDTQMPSSPGVDDKTTVSEPQSVPNPNTVVSQTPPTYLEPRKESTNAIKPRRSLLWILAGTGTIGVIVFIGIVMFVANRMRNANNIPPTNIPNLATNNTAVPTNSAIPPIPTSTTTMEINPGESFRDDFDGQLSEGWTWLAEEPTKWSLSEVDGSLQIMATDASFDGPTLPANILLRDASDGDFEITTSLQFTPSSNFQFAGLVVFEDNGNVLLFGRAFCDRADLCVGDGVYFDNYVDGSYSGDNYHAPIQGPVVYLRLERVGDSYMGYYSPDGENWLLTGEHTRDFSQVRVGLVAAQAPVEIPAVFDYFTLSLK